MVENNNVVLPLDEAKKLLIEKRESDHFVEEIFRGDKVVDYGYRFNMKFQPGITTYESFGCDNLDREAFSDNGKSERDTECVRVGADYKAGSAGMRYNNVGKDGNGNIVDVRLILVGVENAEPRYDLRTAESIVQNKENYPQ